MQPLPMGVRQEPLPRDISIPFPFPFSTGIVPTAQHYPSSYPALKSYPIPPSQTHESVAITPQAGFYTLPTTPDQDPTLTPISYGSLVLTQAPFHSAFDFTQPATNTRQSTSLPNMGDQPPAKRRRIGEETDSTTINSSGQTAELPIWHESRLEPNEDPTPYMEFLGLTGVKGRKFVEKIFTRRGFHILIKELEDSEVILVAERHVAFLTKLFTDFSKALEKRKLETTTISDDQLGKLVVSSFLLTMQISMYLKREKKYLLPKVFYLVLNFINQNHCVAPYVESGINIDTIICHHLLGGKFKLQLIIWCAEQGISLNQEELKYLSTETFRAHLSSGTALLKELRERVKEQQKNATS
jgi:hypothetical protein